MSETISWQKAIAILTAERERAETAVRIIKRLGGPVDLSAAEITYGGGRAEAEAVLGALTIVLEAGKGADDLADLEARMARAVAARETLGARAHELAAGTKSLALDLLVQVLPVLLSAIGALWQLRIERNAATRNAIAIRLDAARWPAFDTIASE